MIKKIVNHIAKIWKKIFDKSYFKYITFEAKDKINQKEIIVLKDDGIVEFLCPCGCGGRETLFIENSVDIEDGVWTCDIKNNKVTIMNSIWTSLPCKSHYWIKNSMVYFV